MLKTKHVVYIGTLLRTLQAGIENIITPIKNLSRLLRRNLSSFMRVSVSVLIAVGSALKLFAATS